MEKDKKMLNKVTKLFLVSTSFAPVLLTLWFSKFSKNWYFIDGLWYLIITAVLILFCFLILKSSEEYLEKLPIKIKSLSTSDKEIIAFIIVYLLPLINKYSFQINSKLLIFIIALLFISVWTTNSYHFNPLLGLFGYHFYEVTIEGDITYILITRKNLVNSKQIKTVVQISDYMLLETGD